MAANNTQRSYRAPCPGCGAPVDFRSAQSTHAVCAYCQSMVVRQGEVLQRIGKMAELLDDHSPLQLLAQGSWQGQAFTLVGRLQYKYGEGSWTEWQVLLADGSSATLGEDNGAYVFSRPLEALQQVPPASALRVGATTAVQGVSYAVSSNQQVALMSAQGELPHLPVLGQPFAMVELRSQGEGPPQVLSIDYGGAQPVLSLGSAVLLEDLQLGGLRDASTKEEKGRAFNCPNCAAPLTLQLAQSKSMTCPSCNSIIDVSQGLGGELRHALQDEPVQPMIALGSSATLQGVQWQVVGYQHRMGYEPSDPDEHFGWEEYLLFNAKRGFIFLVDSTEGWSLVKPATGAPVVSENLQQATYLGTRYSLKESYQAETNFVLGEFYWQVFRGQKTSNRDYVSGKNLLSLESTAQEQTWSVGAKIDSDVVAKAFGLNDKKELLKRSDVAPFTASANSFYMRPQFWIVVVFFLVVLAMSTCSDNCDPNTQNCASSTRTSGASFGGFSTGGGHK